MVTTIKPGDRLLTLKDVMAMLKVSHPVIYKWINEGRFPHQIRLGPRSVRWSERAILDWLNDGGQDWDPVEGQ